MTIACRTGCGEQIENEHYSFSDGFIYRLPLNEDGSIHNCKNLSDFGRGCWSNDELEKMKKLDVILYGKEREIKKNQVYKTPWGEIEELQKLRKTVESDTTKFLENLTAKNVPVEYLKPSKNGLRADYFLLLSEAAIQCRGISNEDAYKILLKNVQMRCLLYPTPFLENPNFLECSDIEFLSTMYELNNDYESAIKASLIQDRITHNQTERILELVKIQNTMTKLNDKIILEFNLTAIELRDNYYRKVENVIKSFIRKKYLNMNDFKNDFPEFYKIGNSKREKSSSNIERTNDDVIEYLSFGSCVKILKIKKHEKNNPWNEIEYHIIEHAYYVVDRRNDTDHFSDYDLDTHIPKKVKILGYLFSDEIIDFFEKLNYA